MEIDTEGILRAISKIDIGCHWYWEYNRIQRGFMQYWADYFLDGKAE